jgi:AcrR family transcriptional regulator
MKAPRKPKTAYHHGDLRQALRVAANAILEEEGLEGLSLRAVARRAGVSHAAPYRHYSNHETLLVEMASDGFAELRSSIDAASAAPNHKIDRITDIGGAYMRFVARRPALTRLMFGPQLRARDRFPEMVAAVEEIGTQIGVALQDPALGLAVWAAVHGLSMLVLEDVIDLGQRQAGLTVLPSRAEIVLRSLFSVA